MEVSRRNIVALVVGAAGAVVAKAAKAESPAGADPLAHSHAQPDVTDLVSDLAGKAAVGHEHSGTTPSHYITSGEPRYDVKGFGPVSTASDRRSTLQTAIDAWGATGGVLNLHGAYDISGGSVTLPALPLTSHTVFKMVGSGDATLSTTSAHPLITDSVPSDMNALNNRANRRFVFEDLRLVGTGDAAQTLLRVIGSFGSVFRNLCLQSGYDGLDLIFALQPVVDNCKAVQNAGRSLRLRSASAIVTGATGSSSGTNDAHVTSWRDYCGVGQAASISLFEADGAIIDNLIVEGGDPVNSVHFDANSNTTVKTFNINGFHCENTASQSAIRLTNMSGGNVRIQDVFYQSAQTVIDASDCPPSMTLFPSLSYRVYGAPLFKGDLRGCRWVFFYALAGNNPLSSEIWVDGVVPVYAVAHRFTDGTDAMGDEFPALDGGTGGLLLNAGNLWLAAGSGVWVRTSDIELETPGKGVILKSPDGTRYRVTVANGGALMTTAV